MTDRILATLICLALTASACTTTVPSQPTAGREIGSELPLSTTPRPVSTRPRPTSINGQQACTIVDPDLVAIVGVTGAAPRPARNEWGSTCGYASGDVYLFALLTDGPQQGLAQLTPGTGAEITTRTVGRYHARQEVIPHTCTLTTEVVPGRALMIEYSDSGSDAAHLCQQVDALTIAAVAPLTG